MLNHQVMMDHMYAMRKFPTPGAELFGKGRANPHPVPGGGEWGISLIPALARCKRLVVGLVYKSQNIFHES